MGVYRLPYRTRETNWTIKTFKVSLQMAELLFLHVKSQHPTLRWWHFWLCMKIQKKRLEFKEQYSALLTANIFRMIFGGVIFIIPLMIGIQVSSKNEVNMSFLYKQKQISNVIQKEKYGKETVRLTNLISHLQSMALFFFFKKEWSKDIPCVWHDKNYVGVSIAFMKND